MSEQKPESPTGGPAEVGSAASEAADERAEVAVVEPSAEVVAVRKGMFGAKGSGDTSGYGGLRRIVEFPAPSPPPFGGWWDQVYERLRHLMGEGGAPFGIPNAVVPNYSEVITKVVIHRGEITFHVAREYLPMLARHLRDDAHLRFEFDLWQRLLRGDPETFMRFALFAGATPGWFAQLGDGIDAVVSMAAASLAPGSVRQAELDGRVDIRDRVGAITAPTLVVAGVHDRIVPIEYQRALAQAISGARLVELDCGHLVPTERGIELAELLTDWFAGH